MSRTESTVIYTHLNRIHKYPSGYAWIVLGPLGISQTPMGLRYSPRMSYTTSYRLPYIQDSFNRIFIEELW